jgi:hypothetical protein
MIQPYHFWIYAQKSQSQLTIEIMYTHVYFSTIHNLAIHNSQLMESV